MRFLALLCLCLLVQTANARIYHYVAEDGRQVYVDNPGKVPPQYRDQLQIREVDIREAAADKAAERAQASRLRTTELELRQNRRELEILLASLATPYQLTNNRLLLPVRVVYGNRNRQLQLVVDSGASLTVLHQQALQGLRVRTRPAGHGRVADGRLVAMEEVTFDRLEIGPYQVQNATVALIDHRGASGGGQGLLGMDFLYRVEYRIDKPRRRIIWQPQRYDQLQLRLQALDAELNALPNSTSR